MTYRTKRNRPFPFASRQLLAPPSCPVPNELLIENPAATFAVRVAGDSMTGAGVFPGDIAIVDRARTPKDKSVVLALVDGGFTLKRYRVPTGRTWLQAENPAYADTKSAVT